jgi:hypothetical protein
VLGAKPPPTALGQGKRGADWRLTSDEKGRNRDKISVTMSPRIHACHSMLPGLTKHEAPRLSTAEAAQVTSRYDVSLARLAADRTVSYSLVLVPAYCRSSDHLDTTRPHLSTNLRAAKKWSVQALNRGEI